MTMKKKMMMESSVDKYVPADAIGEVFVRLPAINLIEARYVCKTWSSLIGSSEFMSQYSEFQKNNNLLLAWQHCGHQGYIFTVRCCNTFQAIRQLVIIPESRTHSFHAFNGLMLFREVYLDSSKDDNTSSRVIALKNKKKNKKNKKNSIRVMLWNPSIGKSLKLPDTPMDGRGRYCLGFAPSSKDYKVLVVNLKKEAAVYSLNDGCWKEHQQDEEEDGEDWGLLSYSGASRVESCGGAVYWVGDKHDRLLFSFNFDDEKFRPVQLPDSVKESKVWFIFRFSDSIAIFTMSSENSGIWVMEKPGGEHTWREKLSGKPSSDFCNLLDRENHVTDISSVLYLQKSDTFLIAYSTVLSAMVNRPENRNVVSYNNTSQKIQLLGKSMGDISFDAYVESCQLHNGFKERTVESFPPLEEKKC